MRCVSRGKSWANTLPADMIKRIAGAVTLLAILSPGAASCADAPPSVEDVRRFAEDVAIGSRAGARLVKWRRAPTIRLETLVAGPRDEKTGWAVPIPTQTLPARYMSLRGHVEALSGLTGMPLRLMPRDIGSGGDIVVTILPRTLMSALSFPGVPKRTIAQLMGPSRCFFVIWPTPDWGVRKARIVINSILEEDHIKHCLLEELTQSLGLPNDSERLRPSVFNEAFMLRKLSPLDRILVRAVYDPRVLPGMTLDAFRGVADEVVGSYMKPE